MKDIIRKPWLRRLARADLFAVALLMLIALSSCGEFFEGVVPAGDMKLVRKVIPLVVGDRYAIPVEFDPAELSNNAVYWLTEDREIAVFENDTLVALAEGQTLAYAWSSIDLLQDTAVVIVLPNQYQPQPDYPYDMVIYAAVTIHGTPLTLENANRYFIGAYVNNELRGIGKVERRFDTDYVVIRVWSPYSYGDNVTLRCYFLGQARTEQFATEFTFDGERHGTLSNLFPLVLDDTAQEYVPDYGTDDQLNDTTIIEEIIDD